MSTNGSIRSFVVRAGARVYRNRLLLKVRRLGVTADRGILNGRARVAECHLACVHNLLSSASSSVKLRVTESGPLCRAPIVQSEMSSLLVDRITMPGVVPRSLLLGLLLTSMACHRGVSCVNVGTESLGPWYASHGRTRSFYYQVFVRTPFA
jgi:hypothetical protein